MTPQRIAVIGAGIVGVSCAHELKTRGFDVVVIDPARHESAASRGNAGALAYAEILPIASGNVLRKVPKWLLDPLGPLSIRLRYARRVLPWLIRFVLAGRRETVRATADALAALNLLSRGMHEPLYREAGLSAAVRKTGALHLYESRREFERALPGWALRERHGIRFRHVERGALGELEPALAPVFACATYIEDWHLVSDPLTVLQGLVQLNRRNGVVFVADSVVQIEPDGEGLRIRLQAGDAMRAHQAVVAAGAWSRALARGLGDKIPVEAERGYNTTVADPGVDLGPELIFGEHGFVATQLGCGLRIGGGAEFAGLGEPPNFGRAEAMLTKARRFLPGLDARDGRQWMGARPSMPDSRPVIGPSPRHPQVLYAFGHGHVGLTQAPGTARLIAELAMQRATSIDVRPYSAARFD